MSESTPWSSTMDDSPFGVEFWSALSASAENRNMAKEKIQDLFTLHEDKLGILARFPGKTMEAFTDLRARTRPDTGVTLVFDIGDAHFQAIAAERRMLAQSLSSQSRRLRDATFDWLDQGGRWDFARDPLPTWQDPPRRVADHPWPSMCFEGAPEIATARMEYLLDAFQEPVFERFLADHDKVLGMLIKRHVLEGKFFDEFTEAYDAHVMAMADATSYFTVLLQDSMTAAVDAGRQFEQTGVWEPPPRPLLVSGCAWNGKAP